MKKTIRNKIDNILTDNNISLSYDIYNQKIYVNDIKFKNKDIMMQPWFSSIKSKLKIDKDEEAVKLLIEIANENKFNSNENSLKTQEDKKNKLKEFISNFDYSVLESIPKKVWITRIKIALNKNGFESKNIVCQTILNQYLLKKALQEKERYQKIGYILNENDKIDDSNPVNYEIFFDNFFYKKEEWESLDKTKEYDRKYCFYDEWQDTYNIIENNKNVAIVPEKIRTIIRQYAPIKNVYVVNDMYKEWIKNNRSDCALLNEITSYKWDGVDRLSIDMNSSNINEHENCLCKYLKIEQTEINKKMFTYALLHSMRQIIWPCLYNFQHILALIGDTNCGKTKTLQDLFTFKCGKFYCGNLDLEKDAEWTIGEKMTRCVAILWNEKKGINKSANEVIKNFIDLVNDGFSYQKKHEQATTQYVSHNVCFITYNPKQSPMLTDYSVSYEKRYWIEECKQTEQGFLEYIHEVEKEHDQIWAQLYKWCMDNQDVTLELNEDDLDELKAIQSRNKGIDYKDIEDKLFFQLNINKYISSSIIDGEQIKTSRDIRMQDKAIFELNFISNSAFLSLLSQIGMDSRHKSIIETYNILENLGWEKNYQKKVNGRNYRGYYKKKDNMVNQMMLGTIKLEK